MDDLISRQAAIELAMQYCPDDDGSCSKADRDIRELLDDLETLPSAQPELKKGKWIVHPEVKNVYGGTYIECSQCGEKYVVQHMEDEKYCRNCGAKMEDEP